jgi:hypothetical protein
MTDDLERVRAQTIADKDIPRDAERALDQEDVAQALEEHDGNVTEAAKTLNVHPMRLRAFVKASPRLKAVIDEVMEQGADQAVAILYEGLRDTGSFQNRYYAAKEFLRSEKGRARGFGREASATLEIRAGEAKAGVPGVIELRWIDPPKDEEIKTIEHEK